MKKIFIAIRAKRLMETDIKRFPDVETGGLLLGYSAADNAYIQVLEATDGGYQHTVHEKNAFEYDQAYEAHLSNVFFGRTGADLSWMQQRSGVDF